MNGLVLAETMPLNGELITLLVLALVSMLGAVLVLCWASYKAGMGNRTAQVVVGLIAAFLLFATVTEGLLGGPPLLAIAGCATAGWFRSRSRR